MYTFGGFIMDKYELYMIDTLKFWSDKLKAHEEPKDDFYSIALEVFTELSNFYVTYKNINNGIDCLSYLEEDALESKSA